MTEKRFTIDKYGGTFRIFDNGELIPIRDGQPLVDKLNGLSDENEEFRKLLQKDKQIKDIIPLLHMELTDILHEECRVRGRDIEERVVGVLLGGRHVWVADQDSLLRKQHERDSLCDRDAVRIEQYHGIELPVLAERERLVYAEECELARVRDGMNLTEVRVAELVE